MIYKAGQPDFNPRFEIVSCYVEYRGKILLLHRHEYKSEGGRWGVPAGKIEQLEEKENAMLRELQEETGLQIKQESLTYLDTVYVQYPEYHFIYHMFSTKLSKKFPVTINPQEHKAFVWTTPKRALTMHLVRALDECIKMIY